MKRLIFFSVAFCVISLLSCEKEKYLTNGENIFFTGKSIDGRVVQDIDKSEMKMVHGCANCHGSNGKGGFMMMKQTPSIRFADLTDTTLHQPPYNQELLIRFIDHELKSDSTQATTGVAWKMTSQDKMDIMNYLKTL